MLYLIVISFICQIGLDQISTFGRGTNESIINSCSVSVLDCFTNVGKYTLHCPRTARNKLLRR